VTADVNGRLGRKAGASDFPERLPQRIPLTTPAFPVGTASGYAGPDSLRYALLTRPRGWRPASIADLPVRYHRANPVYAVRYAHAHAASTLRQAADLGLDRGDAGEFVPRLLGHPIERVLLDAMSWLPERVAWAARRGQPGEFARYTEELAGTYHDCRERCPALPFGGHSAPRDPDTIRARLWLVTAVRTTLAAGLELLGVSAPDRL
jgi:arginyl-tRNA synthetase